MFSNIVQPFDQIWHFFRLTLKLAIDLQAPSLLSEIWATKVSSFQFHPKTAMSFLNLWWVQLNGFIFLLF